MGVWLARVLGSDLQAGLLAVGAAALAYLIIEELLLTAHEQREDPLIAAVFFVGFLPFFLGGLIL